MLCSLEKQIKAANVASEGGVTTGADYALSHCMEVGSLSF